MFLLDTRNAQQGLLGGLNLLSVHGVRRGSRNGDVVVFPEPATIRYDNPTERVVFWKERDANPFFHFFEALWMLAGRDDVAFPASFAKNIRSYSDDGKTLNGAYGRRWRSYFGRDQLDVITTRLRANPEDRRCVLQMWDASADLGSPSKDVPCNTQATFQMDAEGRLDMCVFNRSNDLVWGALGANVVHFSFLQEYLARCIGAPVGTYWQISANLHAYVPVLDKVASIVGQEVDDPYSRGDVAPFSLMRVPSSTWDRELLLFLEKPTAVGFDDPFFRRVAQPLWHAHEVLRKDKSSGGTAQALYEVKGCYASDWRLAATEWLVRRHQERLAKEAA